ncbi:MAG: GDYXXLXY domain-containing protein [Bacteroidota bacterium]
MNHLRIIFFIIVMGIYLWFPAQLIRSNEIVLAEGYTCDMSLQPIDPYDAFRGRYIILSYDATASLGVDTVAYGIPLYVTLKSDSLGYCAFDKAYPSPPEAPYIRVPSYGGLNYDRVWLQLPQDMKRFYLNEEIAPLAEEAFRELQRTRREMGTTEVTAFARLKVLDGKVRVEQVYFEGQPVAEYVRERFLSSSKQ